jgi:hypothetical protein
MPWTFYNANGQRLSTAATNISVLDIDGATDIGADIVDADLFIIDDGAGGTNRKTEASRIKTYVGTEASKANMEAEATGALYVPPDLVKNSPGVAKAWASVIADGTIQSPSYNMTSASKVSTGRYNFTVATDFSSIYIVAVASPTVTGDWATQTRTQQVGSWDIEARNAGTLGDIALSSFAFGDQ